MSAFEASARIDQAHGLDRAIMAAYPDLGAGISAIVPKPTATEAKGEAPDDEYVALATELGLQHSRPIVKARFEAWLKAEGILVYEKARVVNYLYNLGTQQTGGFSGVTIDWVDIQKYDKAIPYPVLLTVKRVRDAFPEAGFFISEIHVIPDPFLMVRIGGGEYVIERWDEPGFRP